MIAKTYTCTLLGIEALLVEVEVDLSHGLPVFSTVGLPDNIVRESKDRVRTALQNSGYSFPAERVTVNLAPANIKKEGAGFDLPIAIAILAAMGIVSRSETAGYILVGELALDGRINLLWLLLIVGTIFGFGLAARSHWIHELERAHPILAESLLKAGQAVAMAGIALASLRTTAQEVRRANAFNYQPIVEVAVLFAGIFLTMIPAVWILDALGQQGALGLDRPWQFFWATGGLSGFLDNAPTYLTFTAAASGLHHTDPGALSELIHSTGQIDASSATAGLAPGAALLEAISCGAVFMGANTYIGNGPNFMVKAIAEQDGVEMPGFFGYMLWSGAILLPIFAGLTWVFFRG